MTALPHDFITRHIGLTPEDHDKMLADLGHESPSAFLDAAVPADIQTGEPLDLPPALSETRALARLRELADQNQVLTSCIGMGWNDCITPAVIRRNMIENPAWYTSYTPYQPEISQGRLEMLTVFQTMVAELTGCELANASMLDEATAAAEAMTFLRRGDKTKRTGFFVDAECHPQTIEVVQTRAEPLGIDVIVGDPTTDLDPETVYGALLAHTGTTGRLLDFTTIAEALHAAGAGVAATTDLLACAIVTPPGEMGADVVVGSAQRFGVPMGFGGPHAGFMATYQDRARQLPGRLVGVSVDANGKQAYRLALQTREQHIRREKATSNICTAQALLANVAAAYGCWHGPDGLRSIAWDIHAHTIGLAAKLDGLGFPTQSETFFDTITVGATGQAKTIVERAAAAGVNLRLVDDDRVGITFDETTTTDTVNDIIAAFAPDTDPITVASVPGLQPAGSPLSDAPWTRTSDFMTDERFHRYQSEHEMLRWLRRLSDRDLALDRTMIPLGSCTMKLNAAAEMEPITWPEFANMHPFAPAEQTVGYRTLIKEVEDALIEVTGYDAISLQPNAGSQGEYAGLLAIRAYHLSRGDAQRDVCLIPSSAHGTNAASAVLAGMRVVVVASTERGDVDLDDLNAKIDEHANTLAALMVTYPSTHGVYERTIIEICDRVHAAGGQVYTDGANLNALVGAAKPGKFGSDVSHLNLHKTFCIPHGGGGPGVGPVGVGAHLAPFLPGHSVVDDIGGAGVDGHRVNAVSAAPFGSAGILPITWMYITMMGAEGLRRATEGAVLAANYVAKRLSEHYPVLYTGPNGLVAHECIIDLRPITEATGVSADDVAKRLADCGFHAPTMSFPVGGTLMIEPTESESLTELDRFCEAMIVIKGEIDAVANGEVSIDDSVLRHAPHTADVLIADEWDRSYSRRQAAFPMPGMTIDKYFPPVGRVDNAYGDRHLSCSCPPLSSYD